MSLHAYEGDDAMRQLAAQRKGKLNGVDLGPDSPLRREREKQPARRTMPRRDLEHLEQVGLFDWADENVFSHPELALLYAVPNGGKRSLAVAAKLKEEGVKPGVPDVCLPVPRGGYASLRIEMKEPGGALTPSQSDWLHQLAKVGNRCFVATTWEMARDHILEYLALPRL